MPRVFTTSRVRRAQIGDALYCRDDPSDVYPFRSNLTGCDAGGAVTGRIPAVRHSGVRPASLLADQCHRRHEDSCYGLAEVPAPRRAHPRLCTSVNGQPRNTVDRVARMPVQTRADNASNRERSSSRRSRSAYPAGADRPWTAPSASDYYGSAPSGRTVRAIDDARYRSRRRMIMRLVRAVTNVTGSAHLHRRLPSSPRLTSRRTAPVAQRRT